MKKLSVLVACIAIFFASCSTASTEETVAKDSTIVAVDTTAKVVADTAKVDTAIIVKK